MRIASVALAAALLGLAVLATVQAQEPTGSISGRVVVVGDEQVNLAQVFILLIAVDQMQPVPIRKIDGRNFQIDDEGNFLFSGIPDGEYFLVPFVNFAGLQFAEPLLESVRVSLGEVEGTVSALRVAVENGGATTGIEIRAEVIPGPDCLNPSDDEGLSPVHIICSPITGVGGTTASAGGAALAYAGLGVAGLAVAMFAGGLALRARTA